MSIVTMLSAHRVVASRRIYAALFVCCLLGTPQTVFTQSIYKKVIQGFTKHTMFGRTAWVDLDNDKDLDLIYTGENAQYAETMVVYENTGGTFTERATVLPGVSFGTFEIADYDNDGDADILIAGNSSFTEKIADLYRNDGGFVFQRQYSFTPVSNGDIAWFDADNDGDLDVVMAGNDGSAYNEYGTYFYMNTGTGFTKVNGTGLPACLGCAIECADANGDGRVDIMMQGVFGTRLYLNNGNLRFGEDTKSTFRPVTTGNVRWGDFDNDGDLDMLVTGSDERNVTYTTIYENKNGNSKQSFVERTDITLRGMNVNGPDGTLWFDTDNNGRLDFLLSGRLTAPYTQSNRRYINQGNGAFSEVQEAEFDPLEGMSLDAGDFDNDGDPDLSFAGYLSTRPAVGYPLSGYFLNTLRSGGVQTNTNPQPPSAATFSEKVYRREVRLQWGEGADAETPVTGLDYNFYLRTESKKIIMPAVNFTDGHLLTANAPNGYGRHGFANNVPEGTLYYAVQSVDGAKAGSLFSEEKSFYHFNGPESVSASIVDEDDVKLTWLDHSTLETGYTLKRSTSPTDGFNDLATLRSNATTYTDHFSFSTETYYYYRINAYNTNYTTSYDSLILLIAEPATNLAAQSISGTKISLTWRDQSKFETAFRLERRVVGGTFAVVATLPPNTQSYTDATATPCTMYEYRLFTLTDNGGLVPRTTATAKTNCLPVLKDFAVSLLEDVSYTFTSADFSAQFGDPDAGDQLAKVTIRTLPTQGKLYIAGLVVQAERDITVTELNTLRYEPIPNFNGALSFTVQAHDGTDYAAAAATVTLNVLSINDPPVFELPVSREEDEDFWGEIDIWPSRSEYIPYEDDDRITYSLTPMVSDIVQIVFDETSGQFIITARKDQFGEVKFTLTADDGHDTRNTASRTFTLMVRPVNDPPQIVGMIEDIEAEVGDAIPPVRLEIVDVDDPIGSLVVTAQSFDEVILPSVNISFASDDGSHVRMTVKSGKKTGSASVVVSVGDESLIAFGYFTATFLPRTKPIVTDIEESFSRALGAWPNPFSNVVNITLQEPSRSENEAFLHDSLGRLLVHQTFTGAVTALHTENITPGVYVLTITNAQGERHQRRLVKQ